MIELSDEIRRIIKSYADAFWDDMRVSNENGHIVFWVDTWNGRQYNYDIGQFENAGAMIDAILASPEYGNRSKVSARLGMTELIKKDQS